MSTQFKTALVVGASSGIGAALVRRMVADGVTVAAVARREAELGALAAELGERLRPYTADATDYDAAPALFDRIVKDLGGLELFVYNAGVMPRVEESEYNFQKDRQMLEVNVLGAICWGNLAAAHFEAQRGGVLAGVSSVAGERGRRGQPVYTTSKAALTTWLEAMRNRLSRYGVRVVTLKPGPVRTPMTEGLNLPLIITAEQAAEQAWAALRGGREQVFIPAIWGPILWVIRNVPSFLFRRTNI